MHRNVTRGVALFATAVAATAATGAGTFAWSQSGPSLPLPVAPSMISPVAVPPAVSAAVPCAAQAIPPGAVDRADPEIYGDGPGLPPPAPLRVALTARTGTGDTVHFGVTARSVRTAAGGATVSVRLICRPGDARIVGRPTATTGRLTAGPQTLTWRLGPGRATASASFVVQVRPGVRSGSLAGELTTTGARSNCSAPGGRACRATVVIPGRPRAAVALKPAAPKPAGPTAVAPHPAAPRHPAPAQVPPPGTFVPPVRPSLTGTPPALPHIPGEISVPGGIPVLPGATPSPSLLSQVDRPSVVSTSSASPGAAGQNASEVAAPGAADGLFLRPAVSAEKDLSGRAFAFLLGGAVFLLVAVVVVGVGDRLRELRSARMVTHK